MHEYNTVISHIAYGWCLYDTAYSHETICAAKVVQTSLTVYDLSWSAAQQSTIIVYSFWIKGVIISNDSPKAERWIRK